MPTKFLEKQRNIFYKTFDLIARTNIFISVCAASLAAWSQKLFTGQINLAVVWITLGATFIMYNTQQLYLGYITVRGTPLFSDWVKKNVNLFRIITLTAVAEIYPLQTSSWQFLLTYAIAAVISLLYFMPFSNLRSIPFIKSLILGLVWVLICVVAPLGISTQNVYKIIFCMMQLFFITALCVLFNIKDMEEDKKSGTHTIPVMYGVGKAKMFTIILLIAYFVASMYLGSGAGLLYITAPTFLLAVVFTIKSRPQNHLFYYLYGVDGLILFQSILGLLFLLI